MLRCSCESDLEAEAKLTLRPVTAKEDGERRRYPDVRPFTPDRYRASLAHFLRFVGERATVRAALTTDQVQALKGARRSTGAAEETVNKDLIAVSALASYCRRKGWLAERPVIERFPTCIRIRYLEPHELELYLAAVRPPLRPLFELLVGTGMRLGEVLALRVCDLRSAPGSVNRHPKFPVSWHVKVPTLSQG